MPSRSSKSASQTKALLSLPITDVLPDPEQPRKYFDPDALNELKSSIERHGIIQPILVRPGEDSKYIIVAGERRYKAASDAGLTQVPAIVVTEGHPQEIALIENLLRENLTAIEEAEAIQSMIDHHGYKQEDLVKVIGKAESTISEILSLNKLPDQVKEDARQNPKCSRRVLLEIVRTKKKDKGMLALYNKYKEKGLTSGEIKDQARKAKGTAEVGVKQIIYQVKNVKNRMDALSFEGLSEEDKGKLEGEIRNLMNLASEKFGMTVS